MESRGRSGPLTHRDQAVAVCLAAALFAVYLLTYRGGFHSVDEVSMFAVTESIATRGALDTNQIAWTQWTTSQREAQGFFGRDGSVYSKKGLTLSLLAAPLYRLGRAVPGIGMLQTVSLLNALMTAGTASVLYLLARRLGYGSAASALLAGLFGLATGAWVYARYLFSEPVAGWLLLLAAYFLLAFRQERRGLYLIGAGLAAGLTVLTRANNLVVLPLFAVYLLAAIGEGRSSGARRIGVLAAFGVAVAFPLAIMAGYNWIRSGNSLQTGYDLTIFSPSIGLGLYKLLLSPLRGLFWYTPILLASLVAFPAFFRRHRREAGLAAAIVLVNVGLFSAWTSGEGLSWGSRFMVPILAFWALPLVEPLERVAAGSGAPLWRIGLVGLGGLSLVVQTLGVVVNPWIYMIRVREQFPSEFLENTPVLYDPRHSPVLGQVRELLSWSADKSDLAWWQPDGIQLIPLAVALLALALTAVFIVACLRTRGSRGAAWFAVLSVFAVVLAAGLSLGWSFDRDYQFGRTDDGLHRILDRMSAEARPNDALITVAPYHYHVLMNRFRPAIPVYGFAEMPSPLQPEAVRMLDRIEAENGRIWLVTSGYRSGEARNGVEWELAERGFKASDEWYDDFRLCLYAAGRTPFAATPAGAQLGDAVRLESFGVGPVTGGLLPVALRWQARSRPTEDLTVFVQLLGADGRPVAQQDGAPVGGYQPTSGWQPGQTIDDRHALQLPPDRAGGEYQLWVGLYRPSTGERLPVTLPNGWTGDHVPLGAVRFQAGEGT